MAPPALLVVVKEYAIRVKFNITCTLYIIGQAEKVTSL